MRSLVGRANHGGGADIKQKKQCDQQNALSRSQLVRTKTQISGTGG